MIYALTISAVINLFLLWFCYKLLRNLMTLSEGLHSILGEIQDFVAHLDSIYKMTLYFGDETLGALLDHSKVLRISLSEFTESYAVDLKIEEEEGEEEEGEDGETHQKETE